MAKAEIEARTRPMNHRYTFRMSKEMNDQIERLARRKRQTVGEFIRETLQIRIDAMKRMR